MKKTLYPKTQRINRKELTSIITEKLDGSNIGFFRLNDDLIIAQRNHIHKLSEIHTIGGLYKGLKGWLEKYGEDFKNSLNEGSGVFGEWIGMGRLKYPHLDKRLYLFAKANIDENLDVKNIHYNIDFLIYPFTEQIIPEYIGVVPVVKRTADKVTIPYLDDLYNEYEPDRDVEGFIVNTHNNIVKYVRMKNGGLEDHRG